MAKSRRAPRGSIFESVQIPDIPRNTFNLSHSNKLSMDMGYFVPVFWKETIPGDRFSVSVEHLLRFMPMQFPVMDKFWLTFRAYAVPLRLLVEQDEYEEFITGGEDGKAVGKWPMSDMLSLAEASVNGQGTIVGTLADYLGFPTAVNGEPINNQDFPQIPVSVLPFRAYQFIWNEYIRDEKLQDEVPWVRSANTPTIAEIDAITQLRKVGWRKDYFTSAFTEPQLGEDVFLPFGGTAPVIFNKSAGPQKLQSYGTGGGTVPGGQFLGSMGGNLANGTVSAGNTFSGLQNAGIDPNGTYTVDFSNAVTASINELRLATAIQRWKELNARAGVRLPEWLLAHYHVKSSDARLQRPEYLGGLRARVSIGEVLQTSASTADSALGDFAGHGISVSQGFLFNKYIEEQSIIMICAYVMPDTTYMNGMDRFWFKDDKFDFADPIFGNLGEQEIWNAELFVGADTTADQAKQRFGFQSRYAEYKYCPSEVHGEFRTSMIDWHMARSFASLPELTDTFVEANPDTRIFNVMAKDFQKLLLHVHFNIRAARSLPYYGTPSII